MSNEATGKKAFNILIISTYRDLADDMLGSAVSEACGELIIGNHRVAIDVFADDIAAADSSFQEKLGKANAIVILARFLDVLSLDKIRGIYHHLTQANSSAPRSVFYLREKGELDFKISCPSCGQKLWLRDTDVGKRGRCPNCSKPFVILSQADYLKSQLLLPESMPCIKIVSKDPDSFRSAINKLLEVIASGIIPYDTDVSLEALKHSTVRIQIQDS